MKLVIALTVLLTLVGSTLASHPLTGEDCLVRADR